MIIRAYSWIAGSSMVRSLVLHGVLLACIWWTQTLWNKPMPQPARAMPAYLVQAESLASLAAVPAKPAYTPFATPTSSAQALKPVPAVPITGTLQPPESVAITAPTTNPAAVAPPAAQAQAPSPETAQNTEQTAPTEVASTAAQIDARYAHSNPKPEYPGIARRLGQQGTVTLEVLVSTEGHAKNVTVVQSAGHSALDQAAVQAISRWKFIPATRNGSAQEQALITQWVYRLDE
ncbi:MAG: energy transducer TonB [Limnobacter sp.]|nr:energy transducer TonB [Limnobacter sp.]